MGTRSRAGHVWCAIATPAGDPCHARRAHFSSCTAYQPQPARAQTLTVKSRAKSTKRVVMKVPTLWKETWSRAVRRLHGDEPARWGSVEQHQHAEPTRWCGSAAARRRIGAVRWHGTLLAGRTCAVVGKSDGRGERWTAAATGACSIERPIRYGASRAAQQAAEPSARRPCESLPAAAR